MGVGVVVRVGMLRMRGVPFQMCMKFGKASCAAVSVLQIILTPL